MAVIALVAVVALVAPVAVMAMVTLVAVVALVVVAVATAAWGPAASWCNSILETLHFESPCVHCLLLLEDRGNREHARITITAQNCQCNAGSSKDLGTNSH